MYADTELDWEENALQKQALTIKQKPGFILPVIARGNCMTPQDFIAKWRSVELKERTASQSHFNDLCRLLELPDPISADPKGEWFTFEKGASKTTGGEG